MKLKAHLTSKDGHPLVGQRSFQSFLQAASAFVKHAVDDLGLSVQNDRYKVYTCRIPAQKRQALKEEFSKYKSMAGANWWMMNAVPDSMPITMYYSVYRDESAGWLVDYGLSVGADLYVVGRFDLNAVTYKEIPDSPVLRDFKEFWSGKDIRTHSLLDNIRIMMRYMDLGHGSVTMPQVVGDEVVVSIYKLGIWEKRFDKIKWAKGEPEKHLKAFQEWVGTMPWWNLTELFVRPSDTGWCDFAIRVREEDCD